MFIDDSVRLLHMRTAAKEAIAFAQGHTRNDLETNRMLTLSLVKCVEIVGEAASRITRERQNETPQIPWTQVIGMRNRLTHAYFDINLDVVWSTVIEDLPNLLIELEAIIDSDQPE
ncbi:DUF86 domain-containing protein [Phormidesmis sp. 146-35]